MDIRGEEEEKASPTPCQSEQSTGRWSSRSKRIVKKKISLAYLLNEVCSSQETCIEWLKNKGLIPKIMFCPSCSRKMKFVIEEASLDGFVWVCQECRIDPPQYSTRHGSWLESKDASLVDILLLTYLWAHGFSEAQMAKEANMERDAVRQWNEMCLEICDAVQRKNMLVQQCDGESIVKSSNKESIFSVWRKKNRYKDPFLEFLKDADSL